jgi:hypothetical protein
LSFSYSNIFLLERSSFLEEIQGSQERGFATVIMASNQGDAAQRDNARISNGAITSDSDLLEIRHVILTASSGAVSRFKAAAETPKNPMH